MMRAPTQLAIAGHGPAAIEPAAAHVQRSTLSSPDNWLVDWVRGGTSTLSGITVTPDSAMKLSAVWACVRIRSEDMGKVPCHLYRRLPGGGKERAVDHPVYTLMKDRPNPRMTAMDFKSVMQAQLDMRGNALAIKEFDARGRVIALWPVCWSRVTLSCTPDGCDLFFKVSMPNGGSETFPSEGVVHLRGMSLDGRVGLSPLAYHRETIGLAVAAQQYGAAFFGNSAQPRAALKMPGVVDQPNADRLRADWEARYRGVENAHKLAIFDGGMEYVQLGLSNVDAEYIQTRNLQNRDIWRIYRMPAHKAGDLEKATNNNIEHQSLEYVQDCLLSEAVRWEQTLKRDLLTEKEQKDYFFEFMLDVLLRGDFKSRMEGYAIARNWGLMSADDCRDKENMNPLPDGKGKIYLQPLNMIEAGTWAPPTTPAGAKALIAQLTLMAARLEESNHV